ncbi:MAG: amidohydrolase [Desulfurococcaceae archaeon]
MAKALALVGKVYTSFAPSRKVEGIVALGERIVYAGDRDKALSMASRLSAEVVELGDAVAMPGFVDAHVHLESMGLSLNVADLRGTRSIAELKERMSRAPRISGWAIGRGWDQENFAEGRHPTRRDLDEAVPDSPAIAIRVCGHAAVLNSAALSMLWHRISSWAARDEGGQPTGLVVEEGVSKALELFWEGLGVDGHAKLIQDAALHAAGLGVTSVGSMAVRLEALVALAGLDLPIRVAAYLDEEAFSTVESLGLRGPLELGSRVRVVGVKAFADGSLGARTAFLSEPYSDEPATRGLRLKSSDEVASLVRRAESLGYVVAIHAIGDAALDEVIKGLSAARGAHRIEHLSVVRPDQLDALRRLNVFGVVQPHFVLSDWWVVKRVGPKRAGLTYAFRTLSRSVRLALSTDAPVEPLNPWETVYAAVERGMAEGAELYKYTADESLSVEEALAFYTRGSADAIGDPRAGCLEVGCWADAVVVDRDPLEAGPGELRRTRVLETYVGGRRVAGGS